MSYFLSQMQLVDLNFQKSDFELEYHGKCKVSQGLGRWFKEKRLGQKSEKVEMEILEQEEGKEAGDVSEENGEVWEG